MQRLSFIDFEKGIQNRIKNLSDSIRERNQKEFLEEMDRAYENLRGKYQRKYEQEAQKEITEELIELSKSIHCYCQENIERLENVTLIRIG